MNAPAREIKRPGLLGLLAASAAAAGLAACWSLVSLAAMSGEANAKSVGMSEKTLARAESH